MTTPFLPPVPLPPCRLGHPLNDNDKENNKNVTNSGTDTDASGYGWEGEAV